MDEVVELMYADRKDLYEDFGVTDEAHPAVRAMG